ncbi:MAG: AMP-binding protein [Burkholderiales bacterium]|nr:AMP-binding protein [Pseudomonadota bacterium]MCC7066859.1 AMP-binding protein [Burkholderiales bacterium]
MSSFPDPRETRPAAEREAEHFARLPQLIAHAKAHAPAFAASLADVEPARVTDRAALARLPVVRKSELLAAQQASRAAGGNPFAGFAAIGYGSWGNATRRAAHVYASPGPIYEAESAAAHAYRRTARALYAAGFRAGELVHNSFSYHLTPGGWILDAGAVALGCAVFPAGVGNTEQQIAAMLDLRPTAYVGTPSFLRILLEKADELGTPITSLTKASVSGEYFPPPLREMLAARGIVGTQAYATADLGLVAYEAPAADGRIEGMVLDEDLIVEIVRPGTGEPLPDGEVGEIVVTTFNEDYPLIRFGTGDLSAILPGPCPSGRTNRRIRGWLGRADQTAKVKGMFVHPAQVDRVGKRFAELGRLRLVISNPDERDQMTLHAECAAPSEALRERIIAALRDETKLGGDVLLATPGTLANDGRVIDDTRKFS